VPAQASHGKLQESASAGAVRSLRMQEERRRTGSCTFGPSNGDEAALIECASPRHSKTVRILLRKVQTRARATIECFGGSVKARYYAKLLPGGVKLRLIPLLPSPATSDPRSKPARNLVSGIM